MSLLWFHSRMPADLKAIVKHTDRTLRISEIEDYDGAHNGLQMENNGKVKRIAAAVDASLSTVRLAAEAGLACRVLNLPEDTGQYQVRHGSASDDFLTTPLPSGPARGWS